jgi:hypothetical protein
MQFCSLLPTGQYAPEVCMTRHLYSSFHYADVWRANVVRKSNVLKKSADEVGFYDHSLWEKAKTKGADAIQRLIDRGMVGASVTVVLVGSETYSRPWVLYEIEKSHSEQMGLIAIHINGIRDQTGRTKRRGPNPLDYVTTPGFFGRRQLSSIYATYDWVHDSGYANVARWIDKAAIQAGR